MVAADDLPCGSARRTQRGEMIGGIDLQVIVIAGEISRGMQRVHLHGIAVAHAFQQTATFARKSRARFVYDPALQDLRQNKRLRHCAAGAIWPMRWPSDVLKI